MKKILLSIASVAIVGGVAFAATSAFFSDTETSTGNVLAAGAIDLLIDNQSYVTDETGTLIASPGTSWTLNDLTIQKFFNFTDIKPGTFGEDTISVHVNDNDSWICAAAQVTENSDVDCSEPELADDPTCAPANPQNGELASQVNFAFWHDDGDNVLEVGEVPFLSGPISALNGSGKIALADSSGNAVLGNTPVTGGDDVFIGKAWCFGTLTPTPLTQDNVGTGTPLTLGGTGFTCDGAAVNNAAQTDRVTADLQFYAVQSRNNAQFTCAANYTPDWPITAVRPVIDGVLGVGEWEGCTSISIASDKGTACVIAYTDYLYVKYEINDPTDDRVAENSVGNDQLGLNINPDPLQPLGFGKPYAIILQTGTDPAAFTSPNPNPDNSSSGLTDGWETEWMNGNTQLPLPGDVQTATPYYGVTDLRVSEWRLPLSTIAPTSGDTLKVGGGVDIGDGNSYAYPSTLTWTDPYSEFVDVTIQ